MGVRALWWKYWRCPRTVDAAATDFLLLCNPPRVRANLAARESWDMDYTRDFARRIGVIFDLGHVEYVERATGRDVWSVGWNRWLRAACGAPHDPRLAAERILDRVCELAKLLPPEQRTE